MVQAAGITAPQAERPLRDRTTDRERRVELALPALETLQRSAAEPHRHERVGASAQLEIDPSRAGER
jgi:hypothetical protein